MPAKKPAIRITASCRDLTGEKFGRLTVVSLAGRDALGKLTWNCGCECGKTRVIPSGDLNRGHHQSCGCLAAERSAARQLTHGLSRTPEYKIWFAMIARCHKPGSRSYPDYGARGITVCDRWRESFRNFYADMGARPDRTYSIDRKDNDRGYDRHNCRWATRTTQARNTQRNTFLTHDGVTLSVPEWADRLGVTAVMIHSRLRRGWSAARALATPKMTTWPRRSDFS